MIIPNGTIEIKTKTGGGINPETGYPIKPDSVSWGDPIPCQFSAQKYDNLGMVNGEHYIIAQYSVLIEEQPFESEQIRLKDRGGKVVGEFSVIKIEPLEAVCQLRIWI